MEMGGVETREGYFLQNLLLTFNEKRDIIYQFIHLKNIVVLLFVVQFVGLLNPKYCPLSSGVKSAKWFIP